MDIERAMSQRAFVWTDLVPWGNTSIAWWVVWLDRPKKKKSAKEPKSMDYQRDHSPSHVWFWMQILNNSYKDFTVFYQKLTEINLKYSKILRWNIWEKYVRKSVSKIFFSLTKKMLFAGKLLMLGITHYGSGILSNYYSFTSQCLWCVWHWSRLVG